MSARTRKQELTEIVGSKNVIDDPETLQAYSRDMSFVPSVRPAYVVKPKNGNEIQAIVKWANQTATPLVPVSSGGPHFRGDTVPSTGGAVIVNLSRMKRIMWISGRQGTAMVEPGVTFSELQKEVAKKGLRLIEMERIKEYSWCCGAGGGVRDTDLDFAMWTASERIAEAESTGAEAIVTACPWCKRNFTDAINRNGSRLKVYDIVELLEKAI